MFCIPEKPPKPKPARFWHPFKKKTTNHHLKEYLKMAQVDIDNAVKIMTDTAANLGTINGQIAGLGVNTSALAPAAANLSAAVATLQATVASESAVVAAPAPAPAPVV